MNCVVKKTASKELRKNCLVLGRFSFWISTQSSRF